VTVILGVPVGDEALKTLAGELKRCCGTGGTAKDGVIEIQGDFCDIVIAELAKRGLTAKRAGG
jgi:translation initiation factor 1